VAFFSGQLSICQVFFASAVHLVKLSFVFFCIFHVWNLCLMKWKVIFVTSYLICMVAHIKYFTRRKCKFFNNVFLNSWIYMRYIWKRVDSYIFKRYFRFMHSCGIFCHVHLYMESSITNCHVHYQLETESVASSSSQNSRRERLNHLIAIAIKAKLYPY